MSLQTQAYRAALVLNNRGVAHASHKLFIEALEAFQGAATLMKLSMMKARSTQAFASKTCPPDLNAMQNDITSGHQLIRNLLNSTALKSAYPPSDSDDFARVEILTDNKTLSPALVDAALSSPSISDACFIQIDDMNGQFDMEDAKFGMDMSIIMYNIGSLCLLYGTSLNEKEQHSKVKQQFCRSINSYQSALNIISLERNSLTKEDETWLVLLSMIILHRLSLATSLIGSINQARRYYSMLGDHRSMVTSNSFLCNIQDTQILPNAAAAA